MASPGAEPASPVVRAQVSVAPQLVDSSRARYRTRVPCIGGQVLTHCTTREGLPCGIHQVCRFGG